jgi:CheY-like chemotaxis protein
MMIEPKRRVLIIDDDAAIIDLLEECLADEGYVILTLDNVAGEDLSAAVERLQPDCVLLDGERSGLYGSSWDAAARLAASPPSVPVIMFTADSAATREASANESERSQAAGFAAVLTKPFDLDELLCVIGSAVRRAPFRNSRGSSGKSAA